MPFNDTASRRYRPLAYARPAAPRRRAVALAMLMMIAALIAGTVALLCAAQAVHVHASLRNLGTVICANCYDAKVAAAGMPFTHALSLGIFAGGCALVAAIQAIRFFNAGRDVAESLANRPGRPANTAAPSGRGSKTT